MKKILFSLLSASVLLYSTSCSDETIAPEVGGEELVKFTVELNDGSSASRAISDGTTVNTLYYEVYAYTKNAQGELVRTKTSIDGTEVISGKTATVGFPLVKNQKYDVVFWAQWEGVVDGKELKAYDATNLTEIIVTPADANDDTRDAFTAVYPIANVDGSKSHKVTLHRPFAQVNFGVTGEDYDDAKAAGLDLSKETSSITVSNVATKYNALTTKADAPATDFTFSAKVLPTLEGADAEKLTIGNVDYKYLATAYVLINGEKAENQADVVNLTMNLTTNLNEAITLSVPNAPIRRNYRTNVIGNLLTNQTDFTVIVDAKFDGEENVRYEALSEDLNLTEPLVIQEGEVVVLDLNGRTINAGLEYEGRHYYAINNYGTLTIKGNGAINARGVQNFGNMIIEGNVTITNIDTNGGAAIWNEGSIVINGGTFTTNAEAGEGSYGAALNTREEGTAVVNGGNFIANSQLTYAIINAGKTTINIATVKGKHGAVAGDGNKGTTINGGSFELMENPNVSDHCTYCVSDIKGGSFTLGANTDCGAQVFCESTIADGYKAIEDNGVWTVVAMSLEKEGNTYKVYSAQGLVELSSKTIGAEEKVVLATDINLEGVTFNGIRAFNPENPNVFDGQNHIVSNWTYTGGASDMGFIKSWTGTIKNIKFDNCHLTTSGRSAVVAGNVYANIENVSVNNSSINDSYWACGLVAGLYNSGSVKNCTVTNSSVKSNGGTAAIVGVLNESAGTRNFENCKVENCTINNTGIYGEVYTGAAILGMNNVSAAVVEFINCEQTNNTFEGNFIFDAFAPEN